MTLNNNNIQNRNAIALFDFEGEFLDDQISFKRGDKIIISEISYTANLAKGEVVAQFKENSENFVFSENCGWFPYNLVIDIDQVAELRKSELSESKTELSESPPSKVPNSEELEKRLRMPIGKNLQTNTPFSAPSTISRGTRGDKTLDIPDQRTLRKQLSFQMANSKSASQLLQNTSEIGSWEKVKILGIPKNSSPTTKTGQNARASLSIGSARDSRFSQLNLEDEDELTLPEIPKIQSGNRYSVNFKTGFKLSKEEIGITRRAPKNFVSNVIKILPKIKLGKTSSTSKIHIALKGPAPSSDSQVHFLQKIIGKTISTYPWPRADHKRMGDPVCDRFSIEVLSHRLVACVSDGCSWGAKPREAAFRATESFVKHLSGVVNEITKITQVPSHLLDAIEVAHETIIKNKEDIWDAGTTTLIGGILLETDTKDKYVFICINIGDCKAFHFSHETRSLVDITAGNRPNNCDTRDPGGRLGPHSRTGDPDFRNLSIYSCLCKKDDIICLVSDGVHDNLDPQLLGLSPKDLGYSTYESWEEMEKDHNVCQNAKSKYQAEYWLSKLPKDSISPADFVQSALQNSINTTENIRTFLDASPNKRVPPDHAKYPGKLDHTTCLAFKVFSMDREK